MESIDGIYGRMKDEMLITCTDYAYGLRAEANRSALL
jgi:hypothetical protein